MGSIVAEAIPFIDFKHKIRLTKELTSKGFLVQVSNNFILVDYRRDEVEKRKGSRNYKKSSN